MKNLNRFAGRTVSTCLVATALVLGTSTAANASHSASCGTTGAKGTMTVNSRGDAYDTVNLTLSVTDTLADGHHVRVRFVSRAGNGTNYVWAWRANYDGYGSTMTWNTTALDEVHGIYETGVDVARFEGSTLLNYCREWS